MAIRRYILGLLLIPGLCFSQNLDSLKAIYSQYYETALLTVSPSGEYAILNHHNTFGKNNDVLLDVKSGKSLALDKHISYQFLGDECLLMQNMERSRFMHLKTHQYRDVAGSHIPAIITRSSQILLQNKIAKEVFLTSTDGKELWKVSNINTSQFDEKNNRLIYTSGDQLVIKDLNSQQLKTHTLGSNIQWMSYYDSRIYCANIQASQIELYILELPLNQLTKKIIVSPPDFEFAPTLNMLFEIREGKHFLFPMYLKCKLINKENPELKITYSNRNGKDNFLNHHLGIYNIKDGQWDYQPDARENLPVYRFLNDKGDFVVFDESNDVVEEQQNVILDFRLMLDYGKSSYLLPQKRIDDGNYLWDRSTEQFIYFHQNRWMCHHLKTGVDQELLPMDTEGWGNTRNNGLVDAPEVNPIRVKGKSAMILSNQFDYFIVDLKTHQLERITKGEESNIKYELTLPKHQYSKSSWNVRSAEVDLEKEMTFKLCNLMNYNSGFATYSHKKNTTIPHQQAHYREMIPYKNGSFFTSGFALEPLKLTKLEKGKYTVVYESLKTEKEIFNTAQYQVFQYETRYGKANAALLFPIGYDKQKKYPMIVNIYQKQSRDLLYFLPPYLTAGFGFNYMHYLMNGYIVLLPDLQYEIANVKNSVITSLEKSIDAARLLAPVDEKNIGVLGLSYGGYETGLAVTNSTYFKTGVAGVMISDLVSYTLSKSEFISMPNYMRAETQQMRMKHNVFDDWNTYLENSPVYHMKNVNAPVLIWTGLKDKNVPPAQSKLFFLGMKRLQKKAVLLEYTNETHNVFLPSNQLDLNVKIWQWFDYYLKNKRPADWIRPLIE